MFILNSGLGKSCALPKQLVKLSESPQTWDLSLSRYSSNEISDVCRFIWREPHGNFWFFYVSDGKFLAVLQEQWIEIRWEFLTKCIFKWVFRRDFSHNLHVVIICYYLKRNLVIMFGRFSSPLMNAFCLWIYLSPYDMIVLPHNFSNLTEYHKEAFSIMGAYVSGDTVY